MKITITPETETEMAAMQSVSLAGLQSVAVVGVTYEGGVLRRPISHSYGDPLDLMRELAALQYHLTQHQLAADAANVP